MLLRMVHRDPGISKTHVELCAIFRDVMFPLCMSVLPSTELLRCFLAPALIAVRSCSDASLSASESTWHHSTLSHVTSSSFSRGR